MRVIKSQFAFTPCFGAFRLVAFPVMSVKNNYLNREIWKRISVPVGISAFLCLLIYFHYYESVRVAEASAEALRVSGEATLSAAQIVPEAEDMENFKATAYCITGITKSGVPVAPGHVAADPKIIPLGSMIYVESPLMSGIYQVTDTGRLIKGKIIDVFIPSYKRSIEFGRRNVKIKVLRYGYDEAPANELPEKM